MRPKNFDQVVGQEHIVRTLRNQIKSDRISHAYLFCGTRGTGKTSVAKIFAKAVNCSAPDNGQPCGVCDVCGRIENGNSMNVIEIDAASNNSVENIRDIRDEVRYPPTEGRFKVYIIDEVHMLSQGAFNALLKTLEEPPAHVIFILATTDPQKIPVTIHSRCQRFDFKRISANLICQTLKKYMLNEGVSISDEAAEYIAFSSDGAMRDALSVMDQCTAFYYGEEITLPKVLEVCGAVDSGVLFDMTDALFQQNGDLCMEIIDRLLSNGRDIIQFVNDIVVHFRNILVSCVVSDNSHAIEFSGENAQKYREQGKRVDRDFLIDLIERFSAIQSTIKYSSNPRVIFEVECIKICNPVEAENISQIKAEIKSIRKKIENGVFLSNNSINTGLVGSNDIVGEEKEPLKPKPKPVSEDMKTVCGQWFNFTENFSDPERAFLNQASANVLDEKLYIVCKSSFNLKKTLNIKDKIVEKLKEVYQKDFEVFIITKKDFDIKCGQFDMSGVQTEFDFQEEVNSKLENVIWDDF